MISKLTHIGGRSRLSAVGGAKKYPFSMSVKSAAAVVIPHPAMMEEERRHDNGVDFDGVNHPWREISLIQSNNASRAPSSSAGGGGLDGFPPFSRQGSNNDNDGSPLSGNGNNKGGGEWPHYRSSSSSFPVTSSSSSSSLKKEERKNNNCSAVTTNENEIVVDMDKLQALASCAPNPLRLRDMYKYAVEGDGHQRLRNAQFLRRELPLRVAQRAVDLLTLPNGLNQTLPIRRVAQIYLRYLEILENSPMPSNARQETTFTDLLTTLILDRTSIPMDIARGINTWRDDRREDMDLESLQEMEDALYRFFTARVGLRFLTEHHILSSRNNLSWNQKKKNQGEEDFLGCIQTNCDVIHQVNAVAAKVTKQTKDHYGGICPPIHIVDCSPPTATSTVFTYVPHHLRYMVAELLKNSCRATVRRTLLSKSSSSSSLCNIKSQKIIMHPIQVIVVRGANDVNIKISDRGGGVPRSTMKQIWKFAHSTADRDEVESDFGTDEITGGQIRGFGLPLARIYARYFGGELSLKSMEGYGVDAYLCLPRLGDACENLPWHVTSSPGERDSTPSNHYPGGMTTREEGIEKKSRMLLNAIQSRAL